MGKTLEMSFRTSQNKPFKLTVDDIRDDLAPAEIRAAMEQIISKNIFNTPTAGNLASVIGAKIINKDVQDIEL
jgi:hypothetical protein